ncbi:unnamed protein product [Pedinophyceae sp. YPF-701]|nr:unnamed protein product [Pedinophyceae sp. YPF-701]
MIYVRRLLLAAMAALVLSSAAAFSTRAALETDGVARIDDVRKMFRRMTTAAVPKSRRLAHTSVEQCEGDANDCDANPETILALRRPAFPMTRFLWETMALKEVCKGFETEAECDGFGNGEECAWDEGRGNQAGMCRPSALNFMCSDSTGAELFRTIETCGAFDRLGDIVSNGTGNNRDVACPDPRCTTRTFDIRDIVRAISDGQGADSDTDSDSDSDSDDEGAPTNSTSTPAPNNQPREVELCVSTGFEIGQLTRIVEIVRNLDSDSDDDGAASDTEDEDLLSELVGSCQVARLSQAIAAEAAGFSDDDDRECRRLRDPASCNAADDCQWFEAANECFEEDGAEFVRANSDPFVLLAIRSWGNECAANATESNACPAATLSYSEDFLDARANGNIMTMNDDDNLQLATALGWDVQITLAYNAQLTRRQMVQVEKEVRRRIDASCENDDGCPVRAALSARNRKKVMRRGMQQMGTMEYDLAVSGRYQDEQAASMSAQMFNSAVSEGSISSWAAANDNQPTVARSQTATTARVGASSSGAPATAMAAAVAAAALLAMIAL